MDGGGGPLIARDGNGRFRPGTSGNPAGKKPGTRNRATVLREALAEGEGPAVARVVIDKALGGDTVAARFLLDRLEPKPRGRPIQLELPEGESAAGDVVALFNSALRALAAGEITPAEAVEVSRFLEGRYRVLRAWQLEEKLTRWRDCLPVPGDRFVPDGVAERVVDPLGRRNAAASRPPITTASNIPSPPAQRGERDAQGWRGAAEPYPELGEGGGAAGGMVAGPSSIDPPRPPHPAPAKLGDASLNLRDPPELLSKGPRGERGNVEGRGRRSEERETEQITIPDTFTIPDDLAAALRDRLLVIPGVREIAQELRLLPEGDLHSACISKPPDPPVTTVKPTPREAPDPPLPRPRPVYRRSPRAVAVRPDPRPASGALTRPKARVDRSG